MTILLDIAPFCPPVSPEITGAAIYRRFEAEPDTLAIAVVDADGRPVGLIERNAFLVRMAAQYGRALWSTRSVSSWMKTDPVIADGNLTVAEFCGQVLEERPSELMHGFIVTRGGRYAGVGAMLALLQASAKTALDANHRAQKALEARSRFLATMSHEIRTPLNGVLTVAEIIRRKSSQPELAPLLDTIVESGSLLLRLLNDALDLSRAEASELALDEKPMAPARLVEDVRALWESAAQVKGIQLVVDYDGPSDLWVSADGVRLRQILNNLVSNALKFTPSGSVTVRLSAEEEGACVRLRGQVIDTGPGVPAEHREQIFQPFQQTEEGVRQGGAGLGLAICRQLAERMGGGIAVDDSPTGGAAFTFQAALSRTTPPEATPARGSDETPGMGDRVHVLIADDNPTNRLVAQTLCEMFGCTSECVEDGGQAVRAAAENRFDLILMDIKMPVMGGIEAVQKIRSGAGPASRVPILALTANADPANAAIYRSRGMDGVVQKPINPEHLLAAMRDALRPAGGASDLAALVA